MGCGPVFFISGIFGGGGAGAGGRFEPSQHFTALDLSSGQFASGLAKTFSACRAQVLPADSRYPSGYFSPELPLSPHMWHLFVVPASTGTRSRIVFSIVIL